ncbi:MAG: hypothetical protein ACLU70_11465 [Lachnospira sp.]
MIFFSLKNSEQAAMASDSDTIILRVCNWEEYIDTGDWDEAIELDSGEIKGENSIVKDFEDWYYQIYGKKVVVEYSTVGTNEELYNMLTLGDEYDLICPSEYMIMKLMAEGWLEPFSEQFFDKNVTENYYTHAAFHRLSAVPLMKIRLTGRHGAVTPPGICGALQGLYTIRRKSHRRGSFYVENYFK